MALPTVQEIKDCLDSYIGGERPFRLANLTLLSSLATDGVEYYLEVARGNIEGVTNIVKFGQNPDIDTGTTPQDVWQAGGVYTGQPVHSASPETVEVFSSDANDTFGGTGATEVQISGLNDSWMEDTETIILNGTTPVASTKLWHRIFRVIVTEAGSGATNAGAITTRHTTTTANVFAFIGVGLAQTTVAAYTIPANKTGYLKRIDIRIARLNGSAGSAEITIRVREEGGVFRAIRSIRLSDSSPEIVTVVVPDALPAKADIKIRVESVSDSNTATSAEFEILLIDN